MSALMAAALTVAAAQAPERVRCAENHAPPRPCTVTFDTSGGVQTLRFDLGGGRRVTFVGRAQTGWWSGRLDGKPAMGFERNRGYVVFSTTDLRRTFEYFHPGSEHGRY